MSIFGNIVSAIFKPSSTTPATTSSLAPQATPPAPKGAATASGTPATGKAMTLDEVKAMVAKIAAAQPEKYNWDVSIADLMRLLKLDPSLTARKQLAQELGYKGELNGSAEMNIWLHKQVMTKLAESGGVVPDSLKHA